MVSEKLNRPGAIHCHIFDPVRFPYAPDVPYRPAGQEMGLADLFAHTMDAYSLRHALLVGPNSGYGLDNRCLLDALARYPDRFKGIAVVRNSASAEELAMLQAGGQQLTVFARARAHRLGNVAPAEPHPAARRHAAAAGDAGHTASPVGLGLRKVYTAFAAIAAPKPPQVALNSPASIVFTLFMMGLKPMWASTSRSRSIPGAISVSSRPAVVS